MMIFHRTAVARVIPLAVAYALAGCTAGNRIDGDAEVEIFGANHYAVRRRTFVAFNMKGCAVLGEFTDHPGLETDFKNDDQQDQHSKTE